MNLLIGWNSWSIIQYLFATNADLNCELTLWGNYYKHNNSNSFDYAFKLFKEFTNSKYDKIFISSAIDKDLEDLVHSLDYKELCILEEGVHDYLPHEVSELCSEATYYSYNLNNVWNKEAYKEAHQLEWNDDIIGKYFDLLNINKEECRSSIYVYTDPLDIDFGVKNLVDKVLNIIKDQGTKNVTVVRHPRDINDYSPYLMAPREVPGQVFLQRRGIHIFLYDKTTLAHYVPEKDGIITKLIPIK